MVTVNRSPLNPIIKTSDIKPSRDGLMVECVLNPGAFEFDDKIWLLLRVAERPVQLNGQVSFPIMKENGEMEIKVFNQNDPAIDISDSRYVKHGNITYLSTISHLRLMCSDDGIHFREPDKIDPIIRGQGNLETFGIEDCRVAKIEDTFYLTYTQVSENGVGVGLMLTKDWIYLNKGGMIIPPHNKDCALFEEKINGKFYCMHRPSGIDLGGNFIWLAESPDMVHWGNHQCILHTRPGMWDSVRIGAGASPIKTEAGWLVIYHGADENHRYCLGAVLLDLKLPSRVIARSDEPLLIPETDYETKGFFGNVVFTNGHVVKGNQIWMYYGASDEVICMATLSVNNILDSLSVAHVQGHETISND